LEVALYNSKKIDRLNKLASLIIKYPDEHTMLLSIAQQTNTGESKGNWIPYSGERSAKGLGVGQQVGYALSRGVLDATPSAAREVAIGKVPLPSAKDVVTEAWNSKIFDWTLTALAAIADAIPGPGTAFSIGMAKIQMLKAASNADWLGAAFSALSVIPIVGDAIGALGRAIRDGMPVTRELAKNVIVALTSIGVDEARVKINSVMSMAFSNANKQNIDSMVDKALAAKDKFVGDLNRVVTNATSGQSVRLG
jgi:hypothetical protein